MTARTIAPRHRSGDVSWNVSDYQAARRAFSWDAVERALGTDRLAFNAAEVALFRHARGPRAEHVALRWRGKDGAALDISYAELAAEAARFAAALGRLGVERGDVVFTLCGRVPALYATVLGAIAHGSVASPLFAAFGPEPIASRIATGEGRVLVTTSALYEEKVAPIRARLPTLAHVVLIDAQGRGPDGVIGWRDLVGAERAELAVAPTGPATPALLHFTSGTTGKPKGAVHVHRAIVEHYATARTALDLHDDDVFWCTADPGWLIGTSYGILAPLACGVTCVVDEAELGADRSYQLLADERVTVWCTSPTSIRMLMKAGPELARRRDLSRLRVAASVGEPLDPEAVVWAADVLGVPLLDTWWQTETGGIMIANLPCMEVRPGSMGRPLPGVEAAIIELVGDELVELGPDEVGQIALRPGWPSMFRGYLHDEERTRACFRDGWYLTGDLARKDDDGYYWLVGRADEWMRPGSTSTGIGEVSSMR